MRYHKHSKSAPNIRCVRDPPAPYFFCSLGIGTQVPADARLTIGPVIFFEATFPGPAGATPIQITAPGSHLSQRGTEIRHSFPLTLLYLSTSHTNLYLTHWACRSDGKLTPFRVIPLTTIHSASPLGDNFLLRITDTPRLYILHAPFRVRNEQGRRNTPGERNPHRRTRNCHQARRLRAT